MSGTFQTTRTSKKVSLANGKPWQKDQAVKDGKTLFIRRQFNSVTKSFTLIKGKKNSKRGKLHRHVPCNQTLREELIDIINLRNLSNDDLFFVTEGGNPIRT